MSMIYTFKTDSKVPNRPINEQIMLGARNRLNSLEENTIKAIREDHLLYDISIESGLFTLPDSICVEKTAVCIKCGDLTWEGFSEPLEIPYCYYKESQESKFETTAGSIIAKQFKLDPNDWYSYFGPKSRYQVIMETVVKGVYQLMFS